MCGTDRAVRLRASEGPGEAGGDVVLDHVGVGLLARGALPFLHNVLIHLAVALNTSPTHTTLNTFNLQIITIIV